MPTTMRRAVDVVCAMTAVAVVGGVLYCASQEVRERKSVEAVASDLQRFRDALTTQTAYHRSELNPRGWPATINPAWFTSNPPRNGLVSPDRPWVEVATPDEAALKDPPMRMTVNTSLASFWYNPYQGVIRARVPVAINDRKALQLYNAINGTNLDSIYPPPPKPVVTAPAPEKPAQAAAPTETPGR